jgi:hypothetical protein
MTRLLTEAFDKAAQLPEGLQDELARDLIEEIAWETQWDETLSKSQDNLEKLAEKALRQYREGKTREMGFGEL